MCFFRSLSKLMKGHTGSLEETSVIKSAATKKYENWTKDQLISKILELETEEKKHVGTQVLGKKRANDEVSSTKQKKKVKNFDFAKYQTRFVAIKFAYLGWNYNGLALQKEATPLPTIEGVFIEAMTQARLVPPTDPQEYNFSRCGRTDKGVSAMNQVISLDVRSCLTKEEQLDPANDTKEIQYINILNQLLPEDIRVSAVSLRPPPKFDARFSCLRRHYKYLFDATDLDLDKMRKAAAYYEGENDFRNFCKLDGSKQITNYKRTIISAKIEHIMDNIYCFDLVGSAFLWHQVRCMMANLFLVGQSLEKPELILDMLDVVKTPQKPIYDLASELPLVLYDCEFPKMEWFSTNLDDYKAIKYGKSISGLTLHYQLKATMATLFKNTLPKSATDFATKTRINLGDGKGRVVGKYEPMKERKVMSSFEVINQKFLEKKRLKAQQ